MRNDVKEKALDHFNMNPQLYPIVGGAVTEQAEVNQTLLAIELFRNREDTFVIKSIQTYLKWVLEIWEEWVSEKIESLEEEVTEQLVNGYINGTGDNIFGDYVRKFIVNNETDDYDLLQIAYRFVQREPSGIRLITNQNESKVL